jgi:hypothetical protein
MPSRPSLILLSVPKKNYEHPNSTAVCRRVALVRMRPVLSGPEGAPKDFLMLSAGRTPRVPSGRVPGATVQRPSAATFPAVN